MTQMVNTLILRSCETCVGTATLFSIQANGFTVTLTLFLSKRDRQ